MLRSFFNITLRILWRNKVTSFINIFSLAIGMTAFILIILYVHHEMSYDKFNENYDRIYRLEAIDYGRLPPIIGEQVNEKVPEIENVARLALGGKNWITYIPPENPDAIKQIQVNRWFADSTIFDIFTFPFVQGDPETALISPFSAALTESTARKLFGDKNPIGQTIASFNHQFHVTGIIEDLRRCHIDIDILLSHQSIERIYPEINFNDAGVNSWLWDGTYILTAENADPGIVEKKINEVLSEINDGKLITIKFKGFQITPLEDIYLKGSTAIFRQYGKLGNRKLVQTFMAIAIFVLALGVFNYLNLTTARATTRAKEVTVKKVLGSSRSLLRFQFILDSILVTMVSFLLAFTLVQAFLPQFNQLAMINIDPGEFNKPVVWVFTLLGLIALGFISGIYPAVYLTKIRSISLMIGNTSKENRAVSLRRILIIFQFSISILLIISILTNVRQLRYVRSADLGFNKEQVLRIETPSNFPEEYTFRKTIKERLLQHPGIGKVSFSSGDLSENGLATSPTFEIDGSEITCGFIAIDPDFLDLMDIEIVEGTGFSWDQEGYRWPNDRFGILFNETAVEQFWNESPVGKRSEGGDIEIIGVARDFHFRSLHHEIEPMCFVWSPPRHLMNIKIGPNNIPETIRLIENEWKNVYGSAPFVYSFLDKDFDQYYQKDKQGAKIIGYFTILAILIASMGLFALSSFMAARRTKEIGIRKSLGASITTIFTMLAWDFIKWILLATAITVPIGWYLMRRWLENFAYHIKLGPDIFVLAALIALVIAMLTVSWQSFKTARANPVEALRYE